VLHKRAGARARARLPAARTTAGRTDAHTRGAREMQGERGGPPLVCANAQGWARPLLKRANAVAFFGQLGVCSDIIDRSKKGLCAWGVCA
jgi:hypothetical protein